ncbi:MAG TPA: hypothetical protein VJS87_03980, partial [Solirubrobacterales bacterium]|nr:hypothetical protein [Solirubrobacterales bacterium]
ACSAESPDGGVAAPLSVISASSRPKYRAVSLARASWIAVVVVCAIAAVLLLLGDYNGYAITVGAVGLAAAVNLLPSQ